MDARGSSSLDNLIIPTVTATTIESTALDFRSGLANLQSADGSPYLVVHFRLMAPVRVSC